MPNPRLPIDATRYSKRLAIIVPYRDRAEHLTTFLPHMLAYFQQDKLDRYIDFTIHIVEQRGFSPFNRGKLRNCGFLLAGGTADYFCFHDVDYLPIWADYSWSEKPARLIWHGLRMQEDKDTFFGGVILFDKAVFERINGYPNDYWGWGFEDSELRLRCLASGLDFEHRDGTYTPLHHRHAGYTAPGVYTDEAKRTAALFENRKSRVEVLMTGDGLSNLRFETLETRNIKLGGITIANAFHHTVHIGDFVGPHGAKAQT